MFQQVMSATAAGARGVQLLEGEAAGPMYGAVGQEQPPAEEQPVLVNGYGRPLEQDMTPGAAVVQGSQGPGAAVVQESQGPGVAMGQEGQGPGTLMGHGGQGPGTLVGYGSQEQALGVAPEGRQREFVAAMAAVSHPDSAEPWAPAMGDLVQATGMGPGAMGRAEPMIPVAHHGGSVEMQFESAYSPGAGPGQTQAPVTTVRWMTRLTDFLRTAAGPGSGRLGERMLGSLGLTPTQHHVQPQQQQQTYSMQEGSSMYHGPPLVQHQQPMGQQVQRQLQLEVSPPEELSMRSATPVQEPLFTPEVLSRLRRVDLPLMGGAAVQEEEPSSSGLSSELRRQVDSYMRAQNAELTLLREQVATLVKERDALRQGQGQLHAAVPQGQGQLHAAVPQGQGQLHAAVPRNTVSYKPQYRRGMVSYKPQYRRGMVSYSPQYHNGMVSYKPQYRAVRQGHGQLQPAVPQGHGQLQAARRYGRPQVPGLPAAQGQAHSHPPTSSGVPVVFSTSGRKIRWR